MLRFLVEHLGCVCIQKWFHPNPNLWRVGVHRHSNCDMYAHTVFKIRVCIIIIISASYNSEQSDVSTRARESSYGFWAYISHAAKYFLQRLRPRTPGATSSKVVGSLKMIMQGLQTLHFGWTVLTGVHAAKNDCTFLAQSCSSYC